MKSFLSDEVSAGTSEAEELMLPLCSAFSRTF